MQVLGFPTVVGEKLRKWIPNNYIRDVIGNDSLRLNVSTEWHTGDHGGMSNFPATDIHFSSFQTYLNFF